MQLHPAKDEGNCPHPRLHRRGAPARLDAEKYLQTLLKVTNPADHSLVKEKIKECETKRLAAMDKMDVQFLGPLHKKYYGRIVFSSKPITAATTEADLIDKRDGTSPLYAVAFYLGNI